MLLAAKYFSDNLLKSEHGEIARDYLAKRNIKTQTQKVFGFGFALNGWDTFRKLCARDNQVDLDNAKLLGLIDSKEGRKLLR